MTTAWEAFFTDYESMYFWQTYGWLLFLVIPMQALLALIVLARWLRRNSRSELERGRRIGRGRILAVLGGLLTLIGALAGPRGIEAVVISVFAILGLEFVAIPTENTATVGLAWGIAAFLGTLFEIRILGNAYVTIVGSLILILGSALARVETKRTETPTEMPLIEPPHESDDKTSPRPEKKQHE